MAIALIVFALAALALAWRYTPLREWINVESLVHLSDRFEASPFAPLIVIGGFVLGGLLVIPLTMLIAATGIVFGPWDTSGSPSRRASRCGLRDQPPRA